MAGVSLIVQQATKTVAHAAGRVFKRIQIRWARFLTHRLRAVMQRLDPANELDPYKDTAVWPTPFWAFETTLEALRLITKPLLPIGTKSILFGYHCWFIHPFIVAEAWSRLYGFPLDPRLWVMFFVHDLGYWGLDNLDDPDSGELHPVWGAELMTRLFDRLDTREFVIIDQAWTAPDGDRIGVYTAHLGKWGRLSLLHSRFLCRKIYTPLGLQIRDPEDREKGVEPSRMCIADKLAITLYPEWLYMLLINLTGEIREYMRDAKEDEYRTDVGDYSWKAKWAWLRAMRAYVATWVEANKDGGPDTMTSDDRATLTDSGVWQ